MSVRFAVLSAFLVAALTAALCIGFTIQYQNRADQRWCDLLVTLDTPDAPPTTDRGRTIQNRIGRLTDQFGCTNGS